MDSPGSRLPLAVALEESDDVSGENLDGIAEYPRSVIGVRLALLFRDLGHGKVKISFRSVRGVDANALAKQFGGGGHARASGALVSGTLDEVRSGRCSPRRGCSGRKRSRPKAEDGKTEHPDM